MDPRWRAPLLVAHRAGNRLADLPAAEELDAVVEADVRLYRGRLEVRHLKTAGPLPLLWDRWRLERRRRPRLQLRELLAAVAPSTPLLLDLKGPRVRLATMALEELRPYVRTHRVLVCARRWRLLEPFAGTPVRRVHSVGSARQLARLLRAHGGRRLDGVSIHERLLDARSATALLGLAEHLLAWPVNRPERAVELLRLGVTGLISDRPERIAPALAGGGAA